MSLCLCSLSMLNLLLLWLMVEASRMRLVDKLTLRVLLRMLSLHHRRGKMRSVRISIIEHLLMPERISLTSTMRVRKMHLAASQRLSPVMVRSARILTLSKLLLLTWLLLWVGLVR